MNKVFLTGLLTAVLVAVSPMLQGDAPTLYSIGFACVLAAGSYASRNLPGPIWSMVGIVVAAATNFFTAHPEPTGITFLYVAKAWIVPLAIQILTAYQSAGEKPKP